MKIKKKFLIIIGIIIYLLTYWDILYSSNEGNSYFKDYITNKHFLIEKKFNYIYHIESLKKEDNIQLKKLLIKKVNPFGKETILYKLEEPEILTQTNVFINIPPFFTKKIVVLIMLETELGNITMTKEFYPFLEIGTYEIWKFLFPILWETIQKVPLINI